MSTDPTARRTERAAVAAQQITALYTQFPADEVAEFLKDMTGEPRPDTWARPRHVKRWPPTT